MAPGDTDGAKQDFADAVKYNHSDYELYINIYKNLAAYDLAEDGTAYLNDAFSIKGNDAESLAYRGEIYYLLGQYDNAIKELTSAIDAGSAAANLTLAQVYEAQQDTANAQTYYQAYVDAGVADSEAMNALAQIEMGKLNYNGALSYIEQGLSMESVPNRRVLLQNQIICMEYTGDFAGAYEVMTAYTAAYPDDAEALREYTFLKSRVDTPAGTEVQGEVVVPGIVEPITQRMEPAAERTEQTVQMEPTAEPMPEQTEAETADSRKGAAWQKLLNWKIRSKR